ncbi:TetR family transcriptional regulator [Planotetraspora thailandica]|uniref:TetR family transcriptional regulator n=1 Tax=Planotetraspora thailandica TaxID=487172 RepID=A0A8J3XUX4_9ACTN|nr:TetR family transcriptional regulator [Planotetraspora thailandica]GII55912.1 TetR family transcriptional regulator [Planotetraspora thailandica]
MVSDVPGTAKKRVRDPEARRAAILAAARTVFAERGYAKATIREIAQRAEVTHGLVVMHFSTKEKLFLAAVPGTRDLADSVQGDVEGLAGRVARSYVARMESADSADPFIALVRSAAADQHSAKALLRAMREESVNAYRAVLEGSDVPLRVDLVGAHLIGVTFSRYVLADGPIAAMSPEELTHYLTMSLRGILLGCPGGDLSATEAASSRS